MEKKSVDGEIIVKFKEHIASDDAERVLKDFGLLVKEKIPRNRFLIGVPSGSESEWIENLKKLESVEFAQRNGLVSLQKS